LRRLVTPLTFVGALAVAGVAAAATINGTSSGDVLRGTHGADSIFGRAGNDRLVGRRGNDLLSGGLGADRVFAGPGADRIAVEGDRGRDRVTCGPGRDLVTLERPDTTAGDCEVVVRRISRRLGDVGGQAEAEVEPDSFSWNGTVVAAYQVGRHVDGGAAAIGWARSVGGKTWRGGLLPGLRPGDPRNGRVADPSVAYDPEHSTWLIATLRATERDDQLVVSRSKNGLAWSQPVVAARSATDDTFDKEWIVCDTWRVSGFRGHCYLSYWNIATGAIETRTSTDGGRTWAAPVGVPAPPDADGQVNGAQPVVQPDGTLLVVYVTYVNGFTDALQVARSTDGGATFEAPARLTELFEHDIRAMRAPLLPSVDVDAGGRVYVAWHDCRFRDQCQGTDLMISTSDDGVQWRQPRPVPLAGTGSRESDFFTPGISIRPGTSGASAKVAVAYYESLPCGLATCPGVDAGMVESPDGGSTWRVSQRLNAQPMRDFWIAEGGFGRMLADYISSSWVAGRPVAVFALASEPRGELLSQSIFAVRPPVSAVRSR
jgi:hypothetical protein